jgi:hypothetical protein
MARRWVPALGTAAIVLVSLVSASQGAAQSPPVAPETFPIGDWLFAPSLQLRTRGEYLRDPVDIGGGLDANGLNPGARVRNAGGVHERVRLGLGVDKGPLHAQLTLQDSRAWGTIPPSASLTPGQGLSVFGPYEAFAEAHTSSARPNWLRVGRQVVVWGDGRLLGNADWSPTPRSLDAIRAHMAFGSAWDVELLAVMLSSSRPLGAAFGDTSATLGGGSFGGSQLYAAQIAWTLDPLFKVQAFAFARVARSGAGFADLTRSFALSTREGETYTGALRIGGESKGWRYALEGAYQIGNVANFGSGGVNRTAYAAAAHVARTFDRVALTPTIRIGGAYATGDDGNGDYKQFDPLLPDVHAFHGAMDIFAWSNIIEANARATVVPWTDTQFAVEYRYAQMAEAKGEWLSGYLGSIGRTSSNGSSELGHEIDAFFTWYPWTALEIHTGYSAFIAGDGARTLLAAQARGALQADGTYAPVGVAHYGYLQATLRVP